MCSCGTNAEIVLVEVYIIIAFMQVDTQVLQGFVYDVLGDAGIQVVIGLIQVINRFHINPDANRIAARSFQ
jgi:hypothetical protein